MKRRSSKEKLAKPAAWRACLVIGQVSFREIIRDKVLYNAILAGLLLLGVAFLASKLTYTRPDRVVLDFGLTAMGIALSMIAVLTGAPLLSREFERRTALLVLSKPVTRFQFLLGKMAGLFGVLAVNWLLLCGVFYLIYSLSGGAVLGTHLYALLLMLLLSWTMGAVAVFFSTFTTTSLAVIFSIGIYLVGNSISQIRFLASKSENPVIAQLLKIVATSLPNFEHFQLGTRVTYDLGVSWGVGAMTVAYGGVMIALLVMLSGILVYRRDI